MPPSYEPISLWLKGRASWKKPNVWPKMHSVPNCRHKSNKFGALAEFEKSLIRERTLAGLEAARARGKQPGRRRVLTDAQCEEIHDALGAGAAVRDIASRYIVHPRTVARGVERLGQGCSNPVTGTG
ncbi:recombinase family protein [Rhizobium sp. LEGMi198b]